MAPLVSSDDSHAGGSTNTASGVRIYSVPIQIAAVDEASLQATDALVTLKQTITLPGITGSFYVTLSKLVPVAP